MRLFTSVLLFLALIGFSHFTINSSPNEAMSVVKMDFEKGLEEWGKHTVAYAKTWSDRQDLEAIRAQHFAARRAYKEIEWLATFLDEGAIKRYINGAPLPSVEQKVADLQVLKPGGFQVMEEMLAEPILDSSAFAKTLQDLVAATPRIVRDLRRRPLNQSKIFAAGRYELVRIFSLGVTGFDTPASDQSLLENAIALQAIEDGLMPLIQMSGSHAVDVKRIDSIKHAFDLGKASLSSSAFETFDRLSFLRDVLDPLYRMLLDVQLELNIETPSESVERPQAHNYMSRSLFADDFLNDYYFSSQPKTDSLFWRKQELGKELFYNANLSSSGTMSCASCHKPELAFSDGQKTSIGIDGAPIFRNAPTLIGAVYSERYFSDMREPTLARQIRHVIQDSHEFNSDYLTILSKLQDDQAYVQKFEKAYADVDSAYQLSVYSLSDALASYVRTLHSHSSPLDKFIRHEREELSEEVQRGFNLFMGKAVCGTCHFAPTFAGLIPPFYTESESEVIGVPNEWPLTDSSAVDADMGRIRSGRPLDQAEFYAHSFKTTTVRNVANTAPYMHNGVMDSLIQVLNFYNNGGGEGMGLVVEHQTLPFDSLSLSLVEQNDLISFMEALTDEKGFSTKE